MPEKYEPSTPSTKKRFSHVESKPAQVNNEPGMATCECCNIKKPRDQFYANKKRFCSKSCSHSYSARHRQGYQRGRKPSESYANKTYNKEVKENAKNLPLSSYIRKVKPKKEEIIGRMTLQNDLDMMKRISCDWNWGCYLEKEKATAAPVAIFKHAVLNDVLVNPCDTVVEVKNFDMPKKLEGFWMAHVIDHGGYRVKLRYVGCDQKQKMDFWVHFCRPNNVFPLAHSYNNGLNFLPPYAIGSAQIDDQTFLIEKVKNYKTLPIDFEDIIQEGLSSPVKIGSRLEIMDPSCLYYCRIGIVREVIGGRIRVEYEDKKADEQNFWTHIKSEAVHPIGWSERVGTKMVTSKKGKSYLHVPGVENVHPSLFSTPSAWDRSNGMFEVGMKLETVDPLKLSTIRVASVMKVLKDGYFVVGIDGMDVLKDPESKCYIHHVTSTSVFPAGYCRENGVKVQGPEGFVDASGQFQWSKYLEHCDAIAAPSKLFQCNRTSLMNGPMHQFKVGMKLEAVDLLNPHLICVATVVKCMAGSLLQIHFDGWVDDHDQWLDANCAHLFPVGWCELFGYELQIPDTNNSEEEEDVKEEKTQVDEQQQQVKDEKKPRNKKSPRKKAGKRKNGGKNSLDEDFLGEDYQSFME